MSFVQVLALLFIVGYASGQEGFFMMPHPGNTEPTTPEPMINEGSPNCAQFYYAPNSLSAKCLVHKLTIDTQRYEQLSISLTGLDVPDSTDTVVLTAGFNKCRFNLKIECIQEGECTVYYGMEGDYQKSQKAKGLRFVVNGDLITAEISKDDKRSPQQIYQCQASTDMISSDRMRYDVRLYLDKAFPGHNFEINGGDIRKYRNGQPTYTTTTEQPTEQPMEPTSFSPYGRPPFPVQESRFPFPPFPIDRTTQATLTVDQRRIEVTKTEENPFNFGSVKNAIVTVNGMQKAQDGKSMILDLTIRGKFEVPNSFF